MLSFIHGSLAWQESVLIDQIAVCAAAASGSCRLVKLWLVCVVRGVGDGVGYHAVSAWLSDEAVCWSSNVCSADLWLCRTNSRCDGVPWEPENCSPQPCSTQRPHVWDRQGLSHTHPHPHTHTHTWYTGEVSDVSLSYTGVLYWCTGESEWCRPDASRRLWSWVLHKSAQVEPQVFRCMVVFHCMVVMVLSIVTLRQTSSYCTAPMVVISCVEHGVFNCIYLVAPICTPSSIVSLSYMSPHPKLYLKISCGTLVCQHTRC